MAITTSDSQVFKAKKIIVSCGRWVEELYPEISQITTTEEQAVVYFDLKNIEQYSVGKFPAFFHFKKNIGFYSAPNWDGTGLKIGDHYWREGEIPKEKKVEIITNMAKEYFGNDYIGVNHVERCWYTNTKTEDFIIDWADPGTDRILICSCCSGHSFKLSPMVGKIASDIVVKGKTIDLVEKEGHCFKIPYHQGVNLK